MAKKVAARTLDFSNVKESSGINPKHKEEGEHLATVTEVRDDPAKDGEAMWTFILRHDTDRTATYPYYCKLVDNQLWKLRNIFIAGGIDVPKRAAKLDPNKLVNKQLGMILEDDEYEGKLKSVIAGLIPKEEVPEFGDAETDDDEDEDEDEEEAPAPKRRARKAAVVEDEDEDEDEEEEEEPAPKKRGRGRPRKVVEEEEDEEEDEEPAPAPKRGRGRPKKVVEEPEEDEDEEEEEPAPKRKRGRPAKAAAAPAKKRRRVADDDDDDLELDL